VMVSHRLFNASIGRLAKSASSQSGSQHAGIEFWGCSMYAKTKCEGVREVG
jgi:hypothetical protein